MSAIRWLGRNLSIFFLAFILAVAVWISAVTASDPNQERRFIVPIDILGQEANTEIISEIPERMELILYAPSSNLDKIEENQNDPISAWIDLSGLGEGGYSVPIHYQITPDIRPIREVSASPRQVEITIEALITTTIPIHTEITGEPALGYQLETPQWSASESTITGRSSAVRQVTSIDAVVDISGASETIEQTIVLVPRDKVGRFVQGVDLDPERVTLIQPITLKGGYRNMVVKVTTIGQVADGFRQTHITVTPPNIMLFSTDPALLDQLPGYVETEVLDINGATDDIETVLALNLPEGISVLGDDHVLVMVGVAALEGSVTLSLDVEIIGLLPGLEAQVAPLQADVIIAGPIPDLEDINPGDIRVVVDLTGLQEGTYQLEPAVEILPESLYSQSISPETVEVIIQTQPTPTPAPTPTPTP
jgi:YbbR domain-containing protein